MRLGNVRCLKAEHKTWKTMNPNLNFIMCPRLDEHFDRVFDLKYDILKFCQQLVNIYAKPNHTPEHIGMLLNSSGTLLRSRIRQSQNILCVQRVFDVLITSMMKNLATEEREGYQLFQLDDNFCEIIQTALFELNDFEPLSTNGRLISPPIIFENGRVKSLFKGKFYGKIIDDWFDHPTIVVKRDMFYNFFTYTEAPITYMPFLAIAECIFMESPITQRELVANTKVCKIDDYFSLRGTTFKQVWTELRGMMAIKWNFKCDI
jgi:hypothetical protein